ncbi:transposase [Methylosinus sp. H3A]|uniref:transposase n=1 Tax=Methylosinus sp. H3A TaxID=2785786 RepID=UPI0018C22135|nr:transposase [Methylosinus sp. H3A]
MRFPSSPFQPSQGKKVTAAFNGGRISSEGGVTLLAIVERRIGIAERLARCFPDRRHPARSTHTLADRIRARIFAISCAYGDANDRLSALHPGVQACLRTRAIARDLCWQPTLPGLENAPALRNVIRDATPSCGSLYRRAGSRLDPGR